MNIELGRFVCSIPIFASDNLILDLNTINLLSYQSEMFLVGNFVLSMEIVLGVPQGSILGPHFFIIFLADLFFVVNSTDIANHADGNTPYATANDTGSLIASLEEASKSLFTWCDNNPMKSNTDKCYIFVSSNEKVTIKIGSSHEIANTKLEKLLCVHLDSGLSFDYHIISHIRKKQALKFVG